MGWGSKRTTLEREVDGWTGGLLLEKPSSSDTFEGRGCSRQQGAGLRRRAGLCSRSHIRDHPVGSVKTYHSKGRALSGHRVSGV